MIEKKKKPTKSRPAAKSKAARLTRRTAKKKVVKKEKKATKKAVAAKTPAHAPKNNVLPVLDMNGSAHENITLDPLFHGSEINSDVVYQAVVMYQAAQREGTASTKDRGHVRGGGKKPWKQKGTGQARHGSRRSPLWRGGGTTFGPMPRDYSYSIPREIKRKAVVELVKDRVQNGKLLFLNQLELEKPKTRLMADVLDALKLEKPLFLVEKRTQNVTLASRNIQSISIRTAEEVNALDLALHKECVMTKAAYQGLLKRLKS